MGIFDRKNRPVQVPLDMSKPAPAQAPVGSMVSLRKEAAYSLRKHEVEGKGVKVYAVFDYSGSMRPWYQNLSVQRLANQVLALGAELDDDGTVEAWYFDTDVSEVLTISLRPEHAGTEAHYEGWVDRTSDRGHMGLTDTARAIRTVSRYHAQYGGGLPGLCVFQTDGSPYTGPGSGAKADAEEAIREASFNPDTENLFFAFVGFGTRQNVDFLFTLDQLKGRKHDNASAMAVEDFRRITDAQLFDGVLKEFTTQFLPEILSQ